MIVKFKAIFSKYYSDDRIEEGSIWLYKEVSYYNLIFKGDLIHMNDDKNQVMYPVSDVYIRTGRMSYDVVGKPTTNNQHQIAGLTVEYKFGSMNYEYFNKCILAKRPFFNWWKFVWVLITKRYIK